MNAQDQAIDTLIGIAEDYALGELTHSDLQGTIEAAIKQLAEAME